MQANGHRSNGTQLAIFDNWLNCRMACSVSWAKITTTKPVTIAASQITARSFQADRSVKRCLWRVL